DRARCGTAGAGRRALLPRHARAALGEPRGPESAARSDARRRTSRLLRGGGRDAPTAPAPPPGARDAGRAPPARHADRLRVVQRHPPAAERLAVLIVLGLDTATWTAAVGVARDGTVLAEGEHRESRSHTASLPALVDQVLARAALSLDDVEGIAVSIGPGSFT